MNPEATMTNIGHASRSTVGASLRTDLLESLPGRFSETVACPRRRKNSATRGWLGRWRARHSQELFRKCLPLHTKAFQSKEACAKQQFENTLEKATWNSHFPVLFFDRKGWKIGAKMYMERAQKSRTSPEERDYTFCNYCIDFWLKQPSVQPFFGLIFSVAFEDVLQQKVPKMLCYYPRKHSRAKKYTQNVNLKRSLKEQPENAIS